jgi:hypothetical protein
VPADAALTLPLESVLTRPAPISNTLGFPVVVRISDVQVVVERVFARGNCCHGIPRKKPKAASEIEAVVRTVAPATFKTPAVKSKELFPIVRTGSVAPDSPKVIVRLAFAESHRVTLLTKVSGAHSSVKAALSLPDDPPLNPAPVAAFET